MAQVELATIERKAKALNKKFFDANIAMTNNIKYRISTKMTTALGRTKGKTVLGKPMVEIILSSHVLKNTKEWHNTLCHEMIHAWQYIELDKMDHGFSFKQKARLIARIDNNMQINTYATNINKSVANSIRKSYNKRNSTKKQYAIIKHDKVWFIKALTKDDKQILLDSGYEIKVNTGNFLHVRHCMNVNKVILSSYYFQKKELKKALMTFETV